MIYAFQVLHDISLNDKVYFLDYAMDTSYFQYHNPDAARYSDQWQPVLEFLGTEHFQAIPPGEGLTGNDLLYGMENPRGELAGAALLEVTPDPREFTLISFAIVQEKRRRRLGSRLLAFVERDVRKLGANRISTFPLNPADSDGTGTFSEAAHNFFVSQGYEDDADMDNFLTKRL